MTNRDCFEIALSHVRKEFGCCRNFPMECSIVIAMQIIELKKGMKFGK